MMFSTFFFEQPCITRITEVKMNMCHIEIAYLDGGKFLVRALVVKVEHLPLLRGHTVPVVAKIHVFVVIVRVVDDTGPIVLPFRVRLAVGRSRPLTLNSYILVSS